VSTAPSGSLEVLIDLVARKARVDRARIRPEARLMDFGLNSVTSLELVVDLEQALGIEIPDQHLVELDTIGEMARYLDRRLAKLAGRKPG
jgi:acyl carrier protein